MIFFDGRTTCNQLLENNRYKFIYTANKTMCIILHMHIFIVTQVILYESYCMTHTKVIQGHPHISFNVSARAFSSCSAFSIVTHIGDFIFKTFSSGPSTDIIIFFERSAFLKSHGQCHGSKWAVNSVVIAGTHNRISSEKWTVFSFYYDRSL